MTDHPMLDKMVEAREQGSQAIGDFLGWLSGQGYIICYELQVDDDECPVCRAEFNPFTCTEYFFWPTRKSTQALLAEYFDIDEAQAEEERRAILDKLRSQYDE